MLTQPPIFSLLALVEPFKPALLFSIANTIGMIGATDLPQTPAPLDAQMVALFVEGFTAAAKECELLQMPAAAIAFRNAVVRIERGETNSHTIGMEARTCAHFLQTELASKLFFRLTDSRSKYYRARDAFGPDVAKHFQKAEQDIEQAGSCLAVEQGTACVFHLMRAMEIAMKALFKTLSLPSPKLADSWGQMLKPLDDELAKGPATRTGLWATETAFLAAAVSQMRGVKLAWRDTTMHVESDYSPNAAEDVFNAVRAFMRHVATRLDENGAMH